MANAGVSFERNMSGVGSILDRGDVTRLSSAADRPAIRTMATMRDPRQILPSEVPVARCKAAVVTSRVSWRRSSSLLAVSSPAYGRSRKIMTDRWKYHSPITAATVTLPTPRTTPHVQSHASETSAMSQPA